MTQLSTASYRLATPDLGVLVATSVGKPRGWYGNRAAGIASKPYCNELAPAGIFGRRYNHDEPTFRRLYRERLEAKAEAIDAKLAALAAEHPGERLVLACWCAIDHPDAFCHRRIAARWLEARYGSEVPELTLEVSPGASPHEAHN